MDFVLTPQQTADALELASETWKRNRNNPNYNYPNRLETHRVGKLGEVAAEAWLRYTGHEVDAVFRDLERESECDLRIGRLRVEVKAWSETHWESYGRCVTPKQLPWIARKADRILWVTVDQGSDPPTAAIRGWSDVDEVGTYEPRMTGPEHNRILNHQVPEASIKPPELLVPPPTPDA